MTDSEPALLRLVNGAARLPWAKLGSWPTPVEPCIGELAGKVWIKREDLSSPHYGGNKVRTLEAMLGHVLSLGTTRIWATGAYGSNHVLATAIHAPRVGLDTGALLFPQPPSLPARANLAALATTNCRLVPIASVAALPFAMARIQRRDPRHYAMPPGGATTVGAMGALSAGLELAEQVAAGLLPAPAQIVLPVGSICTTAGLLAGLALAVQRGLGFRTAPRIIAVRVTPWPITSRARISHLAVRTLARLQRITGCDAHISWRQLHASLAVDGHFQGQGYGHPSLAGANADAWLTAAGGAPLDAVYSAKAAAALQAMKLPGPTLFWATKSTAPLPEPSAVQIDSLPTPLRNWLLR